jgi:hypothetical protein
LVTWESPRRGKAADGRAALTIIQVAMLGKLPYPAMANAIFTHPLLAEGLNSLIMTPLEDRRAGRGRFVASRTVWTRLRLPPISNQLGNASATAG